MERDELVSKLESLAQLDTDAVSVYAEALQHVTDEEVRSNFEQFQGQHMQHADRLAELITKLGGERPRVDVDFVGRFADWITGLRSRRGTEGALRAMESAERYHTRRYGEAMEWGVADPEVVQALERFNQDEQHHLAYVESKLGVAVR
jgi:rubrerythrin